MGQLVACRTASQAWNFAESSLLPVPLPALVTQSAWATAAAVTIAVAAKSKRTLVFMIGSPSVCSIGRRDCPRLAALHTAGARHSTARLIESPATVAHW